MLEIPIHLGRSSAAAFSSAALTDEHGSFLESYSSFIRRQRLSVVTALSLLVAVSLQVSIVIFGLATVTRPTTVQAYTSSVTLNPVWDRTGIELDSVDGTCSPTTTAFDCENASATSLKTDLIPGGTCPSTDQDFKAAMKFDLSSIPANATITDVSLTINVSDTTTATVQYFRVSTDTPDTLSCTTAGSSLFERLGQTAAYVSTANWTTTGSKTIDLGSTADSDVQTRLSGSHLIAIGVRSQIEVSNVGAINSVDNASNKPQLVITYTLPPQAPTNTNHSAITTSTITWTWTDNATAETRYDVKDTGNVNVAGCTNLAANTQSCTETGLTANTQYTRHPNVTDANGNTDGPTANAYTAIEPASGISFGSVTATSITVSDSGTFSNLSAGSSGIQFQENNTSTNSGWITTNSWTKSSLTANTLYSFQDQTRNGDAVTTALSSASTKYTLSVAPDVTSTRTTSTWYTTATFPFTNPGGWGGGGVQYYRYAWDQTPTHSFTGSESTWSNLNANCPSASCTDAGTTLTKTATADGNNWYLHVESFNASDVANGTANYGPYFFDGTNPAAPTTVNDGTGADASYSSSLTTLSANWSTVTDNASGLQKYQYAIGTAPGGTQTLAYTDNGTATTVTNSSLTLSNGTTYYVSVRAVDVAGNTGAATSSNGIIINTSLPTITDNQSGDTTPRRAAGTTYNVDFAKAASGPQLDYAQYAVYSGPNTTGTQIENWTNIFTTDTNAYTTDWPVDFASLVEGTNYVSVRVFALDGLSAELDDVFTVLKDTVAPTISGLSASVTDTGATITWTTNESADTNLQYGTTTGYGTSATPSAALVTSHTVTLAALSSGQTYHAQATSVDQAGNSASSVDLAFTTSTAAGPTPAPAPAPSPSSTLSAPMITNLGDTSVIADTKPIIAGTGPDNAAIFVVVDRQLVRTVLADSTGHFHVTLLTDLSLGTHQFVVRARSATGVVSDESAPISVTIVRSSAVATVQRVLVNDGQTPSVTYYAVAPPHSTIKILLDGKLFKTIHAETATGAYGFIVKLDIPSGLSIGSHQFSFFTVDAAGVPSHQVGITFFTVHAATTPITHFGSSSQYVVQPGDSLWSIAAHILGGGNNWPKLVAANTSTHPSLLTSTTIFPGWVLVIPASSP